ncbi:hypothetical protein BPOR_0505g00090 [Botrytis porri]|uniref:Uncharacterized protein n=1 Tax=Botrytis porri TaxID=87229 RepID=A0A4Z1KGD2_9HELO|nr:hypothetical protein BPOR_0505g00090 [Botrytis porri]
MNSWQDETQRWRTEHLLNANIKNERPWKVLSRQAYWELLDDSDSEYDISDEHLGHYDGCIDCYDCEDDEEVEDEDEVGDYVEDEEMSDQN